MADGFEEDEAFFLPSEFLTFDDMFKETKFKNQTNSTEFNFPSEFPFDFDQNVCPSSRLTELTRQLKLNREPHPFPSYKNYVKSSLGLGGSPPEMVAHFGRRPVSRGGGSPNFPSQPASPPLGPAGNSWAAAELARNSSAFNNALVQKMREEQLLKQELQRYVWSNNHGLNSKNHAQDWDLEKQNRVARSGIGAYGENEQAAWRSLQRFRQQNQENRAVSRDGLVNGAYGNQFSGGVKKQRSGTGVFIPRSYGTNNNNNAKKSGCLTTPILDRGGPGHNSNKGSFNALGSGVVQIPGQTRIFDEFDSDYDVQLAKMKLLLLQRRQHIGPGSSPQEWTY